MNTLVNNVVSLIDNTNRLEALNLQALRKEALSKGLRWEQVKELSAEELREVLGSGKQIPLVQDIEEAVAKWLQSLIDNKKTAALAAVKGAWDLINRFKAEPKLDWDKDEETLMGVLDLFAQKKGLRLQEKSAKISAKAENRSFYLTEYILTFGPVSDNRANRRKNKWGFRADLSSAGLLPRLMKANGWFSEEMPVALRIEDTQPRGDMDSRKIADERIREEWSLLREEAWFPSKLNLAWNWGNPHLKELLFKLFPMAIDFNAYNHRLAAPIIPGGYMENVSVRFNVQECLQGTLDQNKFENRLKVSVFEKLVKMGFKDSTLGTIGAMFAHNDWATIEPWLLNQLGENAKLLGLGKLVAAAKAETTSYTSIVQGVDGSGLYDPEHPLMADLVARYGKVVFQITLVNLDGTFCKGIIVPRQGINDSLPDEEKVGIHLDVKQVKGAKKDKIAAGTTLAGCYIGLMRCWNRKSYFPGSFEMLQYLKMKSGEEGDRQRELLTSLVSEALEQLTEGGLERLLEEVSADDEHMSLIIKILMACQAHGVNVNPMSIPLVRAAVIEKLQKKFYILAQGAGLKGKQYVCVLDKSVAPGTVVLGGFKVGAEVAVWRFPNVLPQGNGMYRVESPAPHQMVDGKIIDYTIFMSPMDLVDRHQGDDDGDIVGVTDDVRVSELFKSRLTENVYLIEPLGLKYELRSEKGEEYIEKDPRGPVGLTTIYQAQLLAVGDIWGALALAVTNQEAIDSAKRKLAMAGKNLWTDPRAASIPANWEIGEDGRKRLRAGCTIPVCEMEMNPQFPDGFPNELLKKFVKDRLEKYGCRVKCAPEDKQNPLAWRVHWTEKDGITTYLNKRIDPFHWVKCEEKSNGFSSNSMVHACHDIAWELWQPMKEQWAKKLAVGDVQVSARELLVKLLEAQGLHVNIQCETWEDYKLLRKKAGITTFGEEFRKLMMKPVDEEGGDSKYTRIENITAALHCSLKQLTQEELVSIWWWELTPVFQKPGKYRGPREYSIGTNPGGWHQVNKVNYAFRAIAFPGCTLLPLLGIEDHQGCTFLMEQNAEGKSNADVALQWLLGRDKPFTALGQLITTGKKHGDARQDEEGNRIELHQCDHCKEHLANLLIRSWRTSKANKTKEVLVGLIQAMEPKKERWVMEPNVESEFNEWDIPDVYIPEEAGWDDFVA